MSVIAKKKLTSDGILFCGHNSIEVAGSCIYIRFGNKQILLECGLYQSSKNNYLDSYNVNSAKFKFNPREIDYVFLNHAHIDHSGLIPRLIKEGFTGKIILTSQTAKISELLMNNCCYIIEEEANILSKRYHREYSPIYNYDDVAKTIKLFCTYDDYNNVYQLDDVVSFKWLHNSHCVGATQLVLFLKFGEKNKKILYTSDIGSMKPNNHYVENTEIYEKYVDVVIMESTYGNQKNITKKTRKFDREHLESAVRTIMGRGGTMIFPAFSFSRTQELLTELYEIFGDNNEFIYDVVVDSKLSCEITKLYTKILKDDYKETWKKVISWPNIRLLKEKEESQACISNTKPKICISSSGFCSNGRIVSYLEKYLKDANSMICFSGYTGDNPSYLSYKVQNYKEHKTININKRPIPNRADCISLYTMSSHAGLNDLVRFGSSLKTNKLILVHGDSKAKETLKEHLEKEIYKNNETYKVVCSTKDMVIHL